jgi:hypothetical protein
VVSPWWKEKMTKFHQQRDNTTLISTTSVTENDESDRFLDTPVKEIILMISIY